MKLRPYHQQSLCSRLNEKMSPHYFGPFEVLLQVGKVAYQLKLSSGTRIHDVFHVSQLKQATSSHERYPTIPYHLSVDQKLLVEPLEVRGVRPTMQPGKTGTAVLIHWKDLPTFEDSWEPFDTIQQQFPAFNLEDKVRLWVVDNVKPPINITYARRGQKKKRESGQQASLRGTAS